MKKLLTVVLVSISAFLYSANSQLPLNEQEKQIILNAYKTRQSGMLKVISILKKIKNKQTLLKVKDNLKKQMIVSYGALHQPEVKKLSLKILKEYGISAAMKINIWIKNKFPKLEDIKRKMLVEFFRVKLLPGCKKILEKLFKDLSAM